MGLSLDKFLVLPYVRAAAQRQTTVEAVNEARAMVALLTLAGALAVCRPTGWDEDPREMSRKA